MNVARSCVLFVAALTIAAPNVASAAVSGDSITSSGPLTLIRTTGDLGCAVHHELDTHGEFFGDTACATMVAVDGTLYGPADIPAGGSATPRTTWTAESQTGSGAGTAVNPYRLVTTVSGGPVRVVQADTYVTGVESYGTRVTVTNTSASPQSLTL
jgi:hypothetical protein